MALTLQATVAAAKNKLSDPGAWIPTLEIQNAAGVTQLRLCLNTEDITWGGHTWAAFPFDLDESKQAADGSIEELAIRVGNSNRAVQTLVEAEDGASGWIVILRVLYSGDLASGVAVLTETRTVKNVRCTEELVENAVQMWVVFTLGAESLLARRFPRHTYDRQTCMWDFKSTECGYAGAETACNRTLTRCEALANQDRFLSFPGIPGEGFDPDNTKISTAE